MLPDKTYEVIFTTRSGNPPEERYQYGNLIDAQAHFNLFFSADSEEMYRSIAMYGFDWSTNEESLLGLLTFEETLENGETVKKDWRRWPVGRKTIWETHDFDGSSIHHGVITGKYEDHAIMKADGMTLWIDDDMLYMFR